MVFQTYGIASCQKEETIARAGLSRINADHEGKSKQGLAVTRQPGTHMGQTTMLVPCSSSSDQRRQSTAHWQGPSSVPAHHHSLHKNCRGVDQPGDARKLPESDPQDNKDDRVAAIASQRVINRLHARWTRRISLGGSNALHGVCSTYQATASCV